MRWECQCSALKSDFGRVEPSLKNRERDEQPTSRSFCKSALVISKQLVYFCYSPGLFTSFPGEGG